LFSFFLLVFFTTYKIYIDVDGGATSDGSSQQSSMETQKLNQYNSYLERNLFKILHIYINEDI